MSFEGFYQALCENGHDCSDDCYMFDHDGKCARCGGKIAWSHLVDQTNGLGPEDVVSLEPKSYRTVTVVDTYHVPGNKD